MGFMSMFNNSKPKRRMSHKNISKKECKINGKEFCKETDKPLKPMIARAGGKTQLVPKIMKKAPEHNTYVEPFVGGGAVFLRKPLAQRSIINDKDGDVIKVFKSFKNGQGFNKCNMMPSKKRFNQLVNKGNKSACDVAYLNKLSFGSGMKHYALSKAGKRDTYSKRYKRSNNIGIKYQQAHSDDYKEKLKNTIIKNDDFAKVMKAHDGKLTFHYLDPPYVGSEKVYKENKNISPERVCQVAKSMKGKVMISYNDHPSVRKACKGMHFSKITTQYSLNSLSDNRHKNKEVMITNY
jgi:DNA adenine methylase